MGCLSSKFLEYPSVIILVAKKSFVMSLLLCFINSEEFTLTLEKFQEGYELPVAVSA